MYWKRYLWISKSYCARITQKLYKEELWNSKYLHVRSQERCTGRETCEVLAEFSSKFCWKCSKSMMHFRCSFGAVLKLHQKCIIFFGHFYIFPKKMLKILTKHDALLIQFWNYIKSASKPFDTTSKVHQNDVVSKLHQKCIIFFGHFYIFSKKMLKIIKKHDALLMQFWNYIKSASKWCSFKTASKLHQKCIIFFGHFYIFSKKNAEHPQKTWCTFDAVLVQFWNYIKSASYFLDISTNFPKKMLKILTKHDALLMQFWCSFETTSKVHQNPLKLHQKCIKMM